jgi:hypothetical protein
LASTVLTVLVISLFIVPQALAFTQPTNFKYATATGTTSCSGCSAAYQLEVSHFGPTLACSGSTKVPICIGDDASTTLAVGMILVSKGFTSASLASGSSYEADMQIGTLYLAFVLHGTGGGTGAASLYLYYNTGAPSWTQDTDVASCSSCAQATQYTANSIGFILEDSGNGANNNGEIVFYVSWTYLLGLYLGSPTTTVSSLYVATYSGATSACPSTFAMSGGFCPYTGGTATGTPQDSYPNGGTASSTISQPLPELPFGLLFLAVPATLAYALIRKKRTRI